MGFRWFQFSLVSLEVSYVLHAFLLLDLLEARAATEKIQKRVGGGAHDVKQAA